MAYSTRSRARSIRGSTYLLRGLGCNKRGVVLERLRLNRTSPIATRPPHSEPVDTDTLPRTFFGTLVLLEAGTDPWTRSVIGQLHMTSASVSSSHSSTLLPFNSKASQYR